MPFSIDRVVPWGRTFAEYRAMFDLSAADLCRRILGCGDGPASFNAELTALGGRVVSVDPLYAFPGKAIERRVEETFEVVMGEVRRNPDDFVWTFGPGPFTISTPCGRCCALSVPVQRAVLPFISTPCGRCCASPLRVFPLLQIGGAPSPHLPAAVEALRSEGVEATVEPVPYEFQRGGNRMLRLRRDQGR